MRKEFQIRVCKEANDLDEKIEKLEAFMEGDKCGEVPRDEWFRLHVQLDIMRAYHSILNARIMEFEATTD